MIAAPCTPSRAIATRSAKLNLDPSTEKRKNPAKSIRYYANDDGEAFHVCLCKNCGGEFERRAGDGRGKDFGCPECASEFLKRRQQRGLQIIDEAMRWRRTRAGKLRNEAMSNEAMSKLCAMLSEFIKQDEAAGRPSW